MSSNSKEKTLLTGEAEAEGGEAYLSAVLLCCNRLFSAVLNAAVDLKLFDIIAKANSNLSASEIASQLPNQHPEMGQRLERMLPLLVSYSLLTCSVRTNDDGRTERVYALSSTGKYLARDEDGVSLSPFATYIHRGLDTVWKDLKDAIIDADNNNHFEKVHQMPMYQFMKIDGTLRNYFNEALANVGSLDTKRVLEIYKGLEGVSTLVDVGGGTGQTLKLIISKYPSIKGINFDLPQVVENSTPHPGIEHVGGDMYASVPSGDAIILKNVLHNWSDENCIKLLSNCHKALPQNGKVIVLEFMMPEILNSDSASKLVSFMDSLMFIFSTDGKERTEKEYESLCRISGFSRFHVACSDISALTVMEFYK